ncbi:hypothetical protein AB1E18_019622 [Capra hircus]
MPRVPAQRAPGTRHPWPIVGSTGDWRAGAGQLRGLGRFRPRLRGRRPPGFRANKVWGAARPRVPTRGLPPPHVPRRQPRHVRRREPPCWHRGRAAPQTLFARNPGGRRPRRRGRKRPSPRSCPAPARQSPVLPTMGQGCRVPGALCAGIRGVARELAIRRCSEVGRQRKGS